MANTNEDQLSQTGRSYYKIGDNGNWWEGYDGSSWIDTGIKVNTPGPIYIQGIQGPRGPQGLPGNSGDEGKTYYPHTAWAYSADGADRFTTVYPNLNLLNFNSGVTLGKHYGWAADAISLSGNRAIFNKIKVMPNSQYTISANWSNTAWLNIYAFTNESDIKAVARYGSDSGLGECSWESNFIGTRTISNNKTFTVPSNVNYIGVSYASISTDTLTLQALLNGKPKLEPGSTATLWMPSASEVTNADWPNYIGQYSDFSPTASTDPTKYAPWIIFKGNDGVDGTSPINLVIDSSNGYQFKNNIINTTFTAKLYQNNKEIDKDGTEFAYVWSKTNADGTADTAWNLAHQTSQKSITITNSDVWQRATFDCSAEPLN